MLQLSDNNQQIKWIDETSYSKTDKQRIPSVIKCAITPNVEFNVHKHIYYGDDWLLSSVFAGLDKIELHTSDLSEAKSRAIEVMIQRLSQRKDEICNALNALSNVI